MSATLTPSGISLTLAAKTAADLMSPNPISLREEATLAEAITSLIDRGISGAAVIDAAGRPVGVLTEADIVVHARERLIGATAADQSLVCDVMTPAVFTLRTDSGAATVIQHMRSLNVHRIFIVDNDGILVGVVTALDLLRKFELPD
jgi:predicted transcriptional regulator